MKRFEQREIREAQDYAGEGGQALHVWMHDPEAALEYRRAPRVFRENTPWAHLFDQDEERLVKTVKRLGVRIVKVERRGQRGQHVDLCAGPLKKAIAMCVQEDDNAS